MRRSSRTPVIQVEDLPPRDKSFGRGAKLSKNISIANLD
jgi:hypothetical protein